ncbi:unnamed protein product [Symbiodinium natans]|uniref:C3H1-type domain-containing protein n=1 Tax=Symbiodinium natans TaxID=878477 RepID=A0A812LYW2_9DINO|nr:unnamed protein product [Symbiodinium natans]
MELAGGPREEDGDTDTPKTAMGGIMVDALNSKLQQLQEEMWNSEARMVPVQMFGNDFAKVPLPGQRQGSEPIPVLLPPPLPHAMQRPPKQSRLRPIGKASVVISRGSVGHPKTCAAACKYVKRKGGCRDGADCLLCHECFWTKSPPQEAEKKENQAAQAEAEVQGSRQSTKAEETMETLTAKFRRLLTEPEVPLAPQLQHLQQDPPAELAPPGLLACPLGPQGPPGLHLGMPMGPPIMPGVPLNLGSLGHPFSCGPACKYVLKPRGCKDGGMCDHCHLCRWIRHPQTLKL